MMSCDIDMLSRYLDGDLALRERRDLERHLAECGSCSVILETLSRNDRIVQAWGRRNAPLPREVEGRIAHDIRRRRRLGPLVAFSKMMPAAVGTSVAALLVLVTASLSSPYARHTGSSAAASPTATHSALVKQSAPLILIRRTQAIVAGRNVQQPAIPVSHRLFDEN